VIDAALVHTANAVNKYNGRKWVEQTARVEIFRPFNPISSVVIFVGMGMV
jgi:hypothetical protein